MKIRNYYIVVAFILCFTSLSAHEIRPAYLEIKQSKEANVYELLWKVPMLNGAIPKIFPAFEDESIVPTRLNESMTPEAMITRYSLVLGDGVELHGQKINFDLLERTLIDVLIYVELADDIQYSIMAQPDKPYVVIPTEPSLTEVIKTYTVLGIEHILLGYDHLLFVACLLLLISNVATLIKAITAFTVAHSITLVGATLDWVSIPGPPVEAVIALSIVFLAREFIMTYRGEPSITVRYPWLVALTFGLLHGFGFAGALGDIGLPQQAIPMALLFFNIGVELGQLVFVGVLFVVLTILLKLVPQRINLMKLASAYSIGGMGMYWLLERITGF